MSTYDSYEFTPADLKAIDKIVDDIIWHVDNYGEYQQSYFDDDTVNILIIQKLKSKGVDFEDYEYNINEKILIVRNCVSIYLY